MSKDSKGRAIGVGRQDWEIRDSAEEEGIPLYDGITITDNARSAAFDAQERKGWKQVTDLVATGQFRGIAVFDADRAARDGWIGESLIKLVRDLGLKGFTVWSPVRSFDLSTRAGVSAWRRAIDAAEEEVLIIRRRTKIALKHRAMSGQLTNGQKRAFGFLDRTTNTHEPNEAIAIEEASADLVEGEATVPAIVDRWAEAGIVTINDLPFNYPRVRDVLLRPINAGIIVASGAERGRLPGRSIIAEDLYREVTAFFSSLGPGRPPSREYLLSRLSILRCADCKSRMHGYRNTAKSKLTYICSYNSSAPKRQGCRRSILMTGVDEEVKAKTLAWWSDPRRAQRDHLYIAQREAKDKKLLDKISLIEDRIVALTTRLSLPPEKYEEAVVSLTRQKDRLSAQLSSAATPAVLERVTHERAVKMWNSSLQNRREMIKAAIRTIYVSRHERPEGEVMSFQAERLSWEFW
jgi:hypothetical protein